MTVGGMGFIPERLLMMNDDDDYIVVVLFHHVACVQHTHMWGCKTILQRWHSYL